MIKIQVSKEHYFKDYDNLLRFISYFYQIDIVKKLAPKRVLEIGVGNKTVSNYLKQNGFNVTTCDFDENLNPDYVGDVRSLPFKDNSFDLILICEVLEHVPFEDLDKALSELKRVSSNHVVISVPFSSLYFEFILSSSILYKVIKRKFIFLSFKIPFFFRKIVFSGEHYWEIGRRGYPLKRIRKKFSTYFKISKEVEPVLNTYHLFFILKKYRQDKKLKEVDLSG